VRPGDLCTWILIKIVLFAVCCTHVCVCVYSVHCMDTYYILLAHCCFSCTLLFSVLYVLRGDQLRWPAGLLLARLTVGFTVWQINLPAYSEQCGCEGTVIVCLCVSCQEEEAHFMRLVSVLHDLLVCDTTSKDKRDELQKYVKTPCRLLHVVIQHFVFVRRLHLALTSYIFSTHPHTPV